MKVETTNIPPNTAASLTSEPDLVHFIAALIEVLHGRALAHRMGQTSPKLGVCLSSYVYVVETT